MAAGDITQLTVVELINGQPSASVWYVRTVDDTGATDELLEARNQFVNNIMIDLQNMRSNEVVGECILAKRVHPTTSPTRVLDDGGSGGEALASLPANQAMVIRKYCGVADANRRGRYFISGIPELWVSDGRLQRDMQGRFDIWRGPAEAEFGPPQREYRLSHYSRRLNQYFDINTFVLNPVLTKIRNRTPSTCSIT